ncbi:hypothetical protein CTAYLR_008958 [Chrysophaeum taylorii]|uniref:Potassium channel domain-containing protein n=1 Tax=Chrysophaeum taylorii TaxID=2483200 RepID=A0AAD7UN78_9STRA|nr:hypothetical protein CTAYLR_008958 [Chrysophaeum taylorii]
MTTAAVAAAPSAGYGAIEAPEDDEEDEIGPFTVVLNLFREFYEEKTNVLYLSLGLVCVLILMMAFYSAFVEGWSVLWAVYFASYVVLGVGYGDLRIERTSWSYLTLTFIELGGTVVVGGLLSIAVSGIFLTEDEEDWVTLTGAHKRFRKCFGILAMVIPPGVLVMLFFENWGLPKTLYWAIDTATTVGCGYVTPTSVVGRVVNIIFLVIGSSLFLTILGTIALYPRALLRDSKKRRIFQKYRDANTVNKTPANRELFVLSVLLESKLVEDADIIDVQALYDKLYPPPPVSSS